MASCLFGGPPVKEDTIKLGESQIGFMNIFARPLFEAVTDVLPAMRFAVDEILTNKAIWEQKIDDERRRRKNPKLSLGLSAPGFSVDPTPSPLSGSPTRSTAGPTSLATKSDLSNQVLRRGSTGSNQAAPAGSRRSSMGVDRTSRRSSNTGRGAGTSRENQGSSRRGSGDPSLTAILVTQTPNAPDSANKDVLPGTTDHRTKADRKDTLTAPATKRREKDNGRPVTAPSQARHSQIVDHYPMPQPSPQSHSQVDLSHTVNGNLDGSKLQPWDNNKTSADSNITRSDISRDSSWWRQMGSRRRTRDTRNGDTEIRLHPKDNMLDSPVSNSDSTATSPVGTSPGRLTTTGKIKSFFKRKPSSSHKDHEKQLSSFGSSSQLRTPPTSDPGRSDPGRSLNSDD